MQFVVDGATPPVDGYEGARSVALVEEIRSAAARVPV
jgi:hypothetical protein